MRLKYIAITVAAAMLLSACSNGPDYSGPLKNDLPHGEGVMTYQGGSAYEGSFKLGLRSGTGTWIHSSGITYQGQWHNDLYHGYGTLTIPGTLTYEGSWHTGLREGYGMQTWADGRRYEGPWREDRMHGPGILIYPDGSTFTGTWTEGKREGAGVLEHPDGTLTTGDWDNDRFVYIPAEAVIVNPSQLTLHLDDPPVAIEAFVLPAEAINKDLVWVTGDPTVATVTDGLVTAMAIGETVITATAEADQVSTNCYIFVIPPRVRVSGVEIETNLLVLQLESEPVALKALISPQNATDQNVTWSSANPEIASVNPGGLVTAHQSGQTTITATTTDGSFSGTCLVNVRQNPLTNNN